MVSSRAMTTDVAELELFLEYIEVDTFFLYGIMKEILHI